MSRPITIGRNPQSTICVSEDYDIVSNDHAEITQQGVDLIYTDHSSNGTIINGQKIQGRSVNIYRGDKIVLAGIYELSWSLIEPLIVPVGRPTVARNIRGDINSPSDGQQRFSVHSRPTELYGKQSQPNSYDDFGERSSMRHERSSDYRKPTAMSSESRSTSAQAERELEKWNWGAFYFGWIWGVFNKVYISLVQLVASVLSLAVTAMGMGIISPIFGFVNLGISIWLGVKGSRMAWDNGAYRNLEHFRTSNHNWNVAAAICFGVTILLVIISLLLFIDVISKLL